MEERKRKDCIHYSLCAYRFAEQGVCIPNCRSYINKERVMRNGDRTEQKNGNNRK